MSSVLSGVCGSACVPFGRLVERRKDTGFSGLEPLSVYIDSGVVPRSGRDDNHNRLGADLSTYLLVEPGDVVFNKLRTWQGGVGVSPYRGIVSPAYFVCRPRAGYEPRFLHYLLRSSPYLAEFARISKFMPPSQFDISWEDLRLVPIPVSALAAQRAIAAFLDTETARMDALITKKCRMIELIHARYRSLQAEVVLQGLDPMSLSARVSLPKGWSVLTLGVLIMLHRGYDLPSDMREAGDFPVISSGGFTGAHSTSMCKGPGVVTGRYGTVGQVFYVVEPYWPLNTTLYVSDFRGNDPRWIFHLLSVLPLGYDAAKSAVTGINRNVIGGLRVPRPSPKEQCRIAGELDRRGQEMMNLRGRLTRQITLLQEHRQALITAAVTGELDVPGAA